MTFVQFISRALFVLPFLFIALQFWLIRATAREHIAEREAWAKERTRLINIAIARHAGEVLALDREPKAKKDRDEASPVLIEGIN